MDAFQLMIVCLASGIAGLTSGVVIAEWKTRAAALLRLEQGWQELRETLQKVNAAHNGLAARIESIQDQVNSHEFKFAGKPWPRTSDK